MNEMLLILLVLVKWINFVCVIDLVLYVEKKCIYTLNMHAAAIEIFISKQRQ